MQVSTKSTLLFNLGFFVPLPPPSTGFLIIMLKALDLSHRFFKAGAAHCVNLLSPTDSVSLFPSQALPHSTTEPGFLISPSA